MTLEKTIPTRSLVFLRARGDDVSRDGHVCTVKSIFVTMVVAQLCRAIRRIKMFPGESSETMTCTALHC